MDFEIDIQIDESALDVEWLNQPSLALKYSQNWAKAAQKHHQAQENVKLVRAQLIKEVTSDPEEYLDEGVKPTAPVVEAYYRTHEEHIDAKELLVKSQYDLNIAEIAKNEITYTRKAALQNLVTLHGQSYFAGPSVPRDLSNEVLKNENQKSSNKRVSKKMKRRKK